MTNLADWDIHQQHDSDDIEHWQPLGEKRSDYGRSQKEVDQEIRQIIIRRADDSHFCKGEPLDQQGDSRKKTGKDAYANSPKD